MLHFKNSWPAAAVAAVIALLLLGLCAFLYSRRRVEVYAYLMEKICRAYNALCWDRKRQLFACLGDQFAGRRRFIRVLEVGGGSGANFAFMTAAFPGQIYLSVADPCRALRPYLMAEVARWPTIRLERHVTRGAEDLTEAFPDESFDAVVATFVLCSVRDTDRVLAEVARVLKPNGVFIFLEHVASNRPWIRLVQRLCQPVWSVLFCDCRLLNDPEKSLIGASFNQLNCRRSADMPLHALLVREQIEGYAVK